MKNVSIVLLIAFLSHSVILVPVLGIAQAIIGAALVALVAYSMYLEDKAFRKDTVAQINAIQANFAKVVEDRDKFLNKEIEELKSRVSKQDLKHVSKTLSSPVW
jgi:uncharacterized membrane protein